MSNNPFSISETLSKYVYEKCTPQYTSVSNGQLKYAISCLPVTATSADGIKCMTPKSLPGDIDCSYIIAGRWATTPEEKNLYCYNMCQDLRQTNAVLPSPHNSALSLYPNFMLSFFTLFVFIFVFFKSKH